MCIRDILQDVEFGGKKVFMCVLWSDGNGHYQVYYKGHCKATGAFVRAYMRCPAAQVVCYLTKRGVTKDEASTFVKQCFDHAQLEKVNNFKYNKTLKLAYVPFDEAEMDIGMAAREDDFIDQYGHYSKAQLVALTQALPGRMDPAQYDFKNEQSITSIHGGKAGPQKGTGTSIGTSRYSLVSMTLQAEEDLENEVEEEEESASMKTIRFTTVRNNGTESDTLELPEVGANYEDKEEQSNEEFVPTE
jgi:hypothetical protein